MTEPPAVRPEAFPGALPAPAAVPPLRVLVADDNPVVRAGLAALLSCAGIEVVAEAADGRRACEAAAVHRPDVILLDVRMPGVDGMSALPHLARLAPVVMLTYSQDAEVVQEAVRRGAAGYLVHGEFTAEQLATAVCDIHAGRASFTATAATALVAGLRSAAGGRPGAPLPDRLGAAADPPEDLLSQQSSLQSQRDVAESSSERSAPAAGPGRREHFHLSHREEEVMELIARGMSNQQIAATCFISEKTVKNHINRIFGKLHARSRSQAIAVWLGTARTRAPYRPGGVSHG